MKATPTTLSRYALGIRMAAIAFLPLTPFVMSSKTRRGQYLGRELTRVRGVFLASIILIWVCRVDAAANFEEAINQGGSLAGLNEILNADLKGKDIQFVTTYMGRKENSQKDLQMTTTYVWSGEIQKTTTWVKTFLGIEIDRYKTTSSYSAQVLMRRGAVDQVQITAGGESAEDPDKPGESAKPRGMAIGNQGGEVGGGNQNQGQGGQNNNQVGGGNQNQGQGGPNNTPAAGGQQGNNNTKANAIVILTRPKGVATFTPGYARLNTRAMSSPGYQKGVATDPAILGRGVPQGAPRGFITVSTNSQGGLGGMVVWGSRLQGGQGGVAGQAGAGAGQAGSGFFGSMGGAIFEATPQGNLLVAATAGVGVSPVVMMPISTSSPTVSSQAPQRIALRAGGVIAPTSDTK